VQINSSCFLLIVFAHKRRRKIEAVVDFWGSLQGIKHVINHLNPIWKDPISKL
jgi:hypothetical protein